MGASITADLSLNTTAFQAAFGRVRSIISGATSTLANIMPAVLGAGTAAFGGIVAGAYGVKRALDLGGELADLAAQTGLAAGELQVLQQAFKNNGMEAGDVGTVLNKMQRAIVSGSDIFAKLGLDLDSLRGQSASDQLQTVGKAIDALADPAERTTAAMEVFGKSGAKALTLFSDSGALALAGKEIGTQAEIMNRNAGLFDDISDKLGTAGLKTQGFFVGVADKVAPVLAPLLDRFIALDLAKYGQQIGDGIAFAMQALADGQLGTILFTSAKIAFANAVNFLAGGLSGVGYGLGQYLVESVKNAVELFSIVTTPEFWSGVGKAWLGIAQAFYAVIFDGIATLLEKLKAIPLIGEKIGKGVEGLRGAADTLRTNGADNREAGADLLAPSLDRMRARMEEGMASVRDAAAKGFEAGGNVIDTSQWESEMSDAIDQVMKNAEQAGEAARAAVADKPKTAVLGADDETKSGGGGKGGSQVIADSNRRLGLGGFAYERGGGIGGVSIDGGVGGGKTPNDPVAAEIAKLSAKIETGNGYLRDLAERKEPIKRNKAVFC